MKAFKTYAQCPLSRTPAGIPSSYPWMVKDCDEDEALLLAAQNWQIMTDDAYSSYLAARESELNDWLAISGQLEATNLVIKNVVRPAREFGQSLIESYAAENIILGITADNMTGTVGTILQDASNYLSTGSLYAAIASLKAVPVLSYDSKYVTAARLLAYVNKIETYLGITLSTSL